MTIKQLIRNGRQSSNEELTNRPSYKFHSNFHKQFSCTDTMDASGRHYNVSAHHSYPSVTTVLSKTKSEYSKKTLQEWQERVGPKEAERIKNNAADRGSVLHEMCENYILDNGKFELPDNKNSNAYHLWRQMYPLLQNINNIHCIEGVLYSHKLKMAGRVDCVAEYKGVLSIIDFKTATAHREEYYLNDYYCQETAYAIMFSEMFKTPVKQIVTLMVKDNGVFEKEGQVFIKQPAPYVEKLVGKVNKYYSGLTKT